MTITPDDPQDKKAGKILLTRLLTICFANKDSEDVAQLTIQYFEDEAATPITYKTSQQDKLIAKGVCTAFTGWLSTSSRINLVKGAAPGNAGGASSDKLLLFATYATKDGNFQHPADACAEGLIGALEISEALQNFAVRTAVPAYLEGLQGQTGKVYNLVGEQLASLEKISDSLRGVSDESQNLDYPGGDLYLPVSTLDPNMRFKMADDTNLTTHYFVGAEDSCNNYQFTNGSEQVKATTSRLGAAQDVPCGNLTIDSTRYLCLSQ